MKRIFWVTVFALTSTLLIFALRLGLVLPNPVYLAEAGPFRLVTLAVPSNAADEEKILDVTRTLYRAGFLKDGHKAKAVLLHRFGGAKASPSIEAGLLVSEAIYQGIDPKAVPDLHLQVLPKGRYLVHSIPRVNLLSLYVGRWKSLPLLEEAARKRGLRPAFRLEIYDKRIRYLIPDERQAIKEQAKVLGL